MPKRPKNLADYIISTKTRINKIAFDTGLFLFGAAPKKKCDLPTDEPHSSEMTATTSEVNSEEKSAETLFEHTPTPHDKEEDEFTKQLMKMEYELRSLRNAYKKAQDDIDRNALHFKIIRLERVRHQLLTAQEEKIKQNDLKGKP